MNWSPASSLVGVTGPVAALAVVAASTAGRASAAAAAVRANDLMSLDMEIPFFPATIQGRR